MAADNTKIYALVDPTNDCVRYVGKSDNPCKRLVQHLSEARQGSTTRKSRWLLKLERIALRPEIHILEEVPQEEWILAEQEWIAHYRSLGIDLTNLTDGGDGTIGYVADPLVTARRAEMLRGVTRKPHSEETKLKISIKNKLRVGRPHTPEARAKISARQIGRKMLPHVAEALRKANLGARRSDETKRKMSEAKLGVIPWAATNAAAKANLGRKRPPEHILKCVEGRKGGKGYKVSEELILKHVNRERSNASGYRGVKQLQDKGRLFQSWQARISLNGKRVHLGCFPTPELAAKAYDDALFEAYGSKANLNFPKDAQ